MYISELKQPSQTAKLRRLVAGFLGEMETCGAVKLSVGETLFGDNDQAASAYTLTEGHIEVELNGKLIYFYEAGDFIVKPDAFNDIIQPIYRCTSDSHLQGYDWPAIQQRLRNDAEALQAWTEYQTTFNAILVQALSFYSSHTKEPRSDYLVFEPGDTIIEEGQLSDCVFTLVEGHASAFQGETKVGDIYEDEIFGAMAAFTNSARSASVVANEPSTVRAVRQEDFVEMVRLQPEICRSLIEDMARKIQDLNNTLSRLQKGEQETST